jgi:hydrogenase nickel incorporation protein HypB
MPSLISTSSLPSFFEIGDQVAIANRQALHDNAVLAVSVIGAPGCGKSMLLRATIDRLRDAGTHACAVPAGRPLASPPRRESYYGKGVVRATTLDRIEPGHVHDALSSLDLPALDVLFIEAAAFDPSSAADVDLGQELRIAIFPANSDADIAFEHADLIAKSDALVLNKTDIATDPGLLERLRSSLRRPNPTARLFELSARTGQGLELWTDWLLTRAPNSREHTSNWFG